MTEPPPATRLVVFDLDGTLVDSQATILACVRAGFDACGEVPPADEAIRRIVGLSLAEAMEVLLGRADPAMAARIAEGYREAFFALRARPDFDEPLFEGAREVLETLAGEGFTLGIATGKAMRGLRHVLEMHGLEPLFATLQTADLHPSKPHPAMLEAALAATGIGAEAAVMIGDTSFDMLMAEAAGLRGIGVAWGNHPGEELIASGACALLQRFDELPALLRPAAPAP